MKKTIFLSALLMLMALGSSAQCTLAAELQEGLVGYWPFCGNANDESGNGNNGVVNGATLTEDRFGNAAQAYSFDGISNNIIIVHSSSLNFESNQTISVWVKHQPGAEGWFLSKGCETPTLENGSFRFYSSLINNGEGRNVTADNWTPIRGYVESQIIMNESWSHLVSVYDGQSIKLYIDGELSESTLQSGPINNTPSDLLFGSRTHEVSACQGDYFFNGLLDDIGIWNRALTAEEVALLYGNFTQPVIGCTDNSACNFLASATEDDGSCLFPGNPCDDTNASTYNDIIDASCGCTGAPIELGVEHTCGASLVHNPSLTYGSMTDQEGNVYKTIVIGDQEWMAENLNTSIYRNGEAIATNLDANTWASTTTGAWAYSNDNSALQCPYGKLYNWYTCIDERELCPTGWRIPSTSDWFTLIDNLGGQSVAGGKMRSTGSIEDANGLWFAPNVNASNSSGFSGVPAGYRFFGGEYYNTGDLGDYWSSSENGVGSAWYINLVYYYNSAQWDPGNKHYGFSVRCMREATTGLIPGCIDLLACNYNSTATVDDGSCLYQGASCDDTNASTYNDIIDASCGCTGTPIELGVEHTCGASLVHNPSLTYGSMTDQEGNVYKTIIIGDQEWMAENLTVSTYSNGEEIQTGLTAAEWNSASTGAYKYYNEESAYNCPFGKLYNWYAISDTRNVCPTGWHIPTNAEWTELISFLGGEEQAAAALKASGESYWHAGNNGTNNSGFAALAGGYYDYNLSISSDINNYAYYWTATPFNSFSSYYRYFDTYVNNFPGFNIFGFSARCTRDPNTGFIPGCNDGSACNYNASATVNDGSCLFIGSPCEDGDVLTVNDSLSGDCVCVGETVTLGIEHTCGAPYVHNPNLDYGSVTDQEGNVYKTIVIGTQEWMAENLNTSIYRNGDPIESNLDNSTWEITTNGAWAVYDANPANACPRGKLYNWYATIDPREVCPVGWHTPNDDEWTTLVNQLGGYTVSGGKMKITGANYWLNPNTGANNSSGFSALPSGFRDVNGMYNFAGFYGFWWADTSIPMYRRIDYDGAHIFGDGYNPQIGMSVRCLRDANTGLIPGCMDLLACNYNSSATEDDGSCFYPGALCDDANANTYNDIIDASCGCVGTPIELGVEHTCGAPLVHNPSLTYGSMTDQEGNVYKTIVIGDQEWMAENLNTSIYRNGDPITTNLDNSEWGNTSITETGAWGYYNNEENYSCPNGKLYNWYACVDTRDLCPTGWHVPSSSDWSVMLNQLDPASNPNDFVESFFAGTALKSTGTIESGTGLWYANAGDIASNSSGFSATPGGQRHIFGDYNSIGNYGFWWTSTGYGNGVAAYINLLYYTSEVYSGIYDKPYGFSVRCVRDANTGLIPGCMDLLACNYNSSATEDDGSCFYPGATCDDLNPLTGNDVIDESCTCTGVPINGCADPLAFNYNPQATINEGCEYVATIFVFNDLNGNGTHEANEPGLTNWPVLGNDINGLVWTNSNGNAFLPLETGSHEFTVLNTTDSWVSTTPTSVTIDLTSGPATASFGLQVIPGEAIVAAGPFTGFWDILHCTEGYESGVYLENIGSQAVSGFMTLTCDPLFTPDADSYFTTPPVEVGPGYALWNVEDFLPGEYELLSFHIDGPGVEYLNQSFTFAFDLTLFDPQGNMIYSDNWSVSPIVACAYDPNDITGFPEGLSAPHEEGYTVEHYILPDNMVEFRVRFQNTGTLPAEDIDIYIPIDPNQWELNTISPLMRSAEMQVICLHDDGSVDLNILEHELPEGVTAQDLLIFSFDDIYLPDSASNPEGSQGYVYFRMQAKHTLSIGDEINAQAFIYFEENPPIATNETYHVLFDCMSFTPMVGDAELCAGDDLQFSASQPNVDDYSWNIGSLEGSGNIFLFEGIDAGEYTLQLNTSNMLCPQGENHAVTVVVNDIPQLDVPLDETVCEGEELTYEAESDDDVSWSNGASTGDVFTAEESFTVTATAVGAGGCSTSADWTVTVNPLPSTEVDSANFVLTAADGVAWQWLVNGVLDATTQSINATENGNYQVEITNEFGCVVMSDVVAVELPIPDNVFVHSWSTLALFPNPMTTSARLELPQGAFDIALYDLTGACVRAMSRQQGTVLIERESLARGVYQVRISNGNDNRSIRLVIE